MDDGYVFKLILVGDQSVGKSSILSMFTHRIFKKDYNVTIGLEFGSRAVKLNDTDFMTLQIWDTAGQEAFKSIIRSFYRNSASVFIIYNVTRRDSFENIDAWVSEVREHAHTEIILGLVGNKSDLESLRQVGFEEGQQKAKDIEADIFFEASAMTGDNIEKMFELAAQKIHEKFQKEKEFQESVKSNPHSFNISKYSKDVDKSDTKTKKNCGCC